MPPIPGRNVAPVLINGKDSNGGLDRPPMITPQPWPAPTWHTTDNSVRIYHGHVIDTLRTLPPRSIHCCVTSPPYWGLRSYLKDDDPLKVYELGSEPIPDCGVCGRLAPDLVYRTVLPVIRDQGSNPEFAAKMITDLLVSAQVKKEPCGRCFVCNMVAVFRGVKRVLRDDGTLWVNLGDSYSGGQTGRNDNVEWGGNRAASGPKMVSEGNNGRNRSATPGLASGNLVGAPWRVALALQADGWMLRQDIIWAKPSTMPESVRNRCTKSHEYIFLFVKRMGYFYDSDAIKEDSVTPWNAHKGFVDTKQRTAERLNMSEDDVDRMRTQYAFNTKHNDEDRTGRNKRSVWTVASQGYEGAHFATFPSKLIEPCILAGTSEKGVCPECGAPWRRVVEATKYEPPIVEPGVRNVDASRGDKVRKLSGADYNEQVRRGTTGWQPTCAHVSPLPPIGATVLDPFAGSGTTCALSLELGRHSIGIDLSATYIRNNAIPRIEGKLRSLGKHSLIPGTSLRNVVRLAGARSTC